MSAIPRSAVMTPNTGEDSELRSCGEIPYVPVGRRQRWLITIRGNAARWSGSGSTPTIRSTAVDSAHPVTHARRFDGIEFPY